jgi:hypothetical protein
MSWESNRAKLAEPSRVERFSGAHLGRKRKRSAKSSRSRRGPQEIDHGTLTGGVFGGFGVKHERTTSLSRWAAARSATSALGSVCLGRGTASGFIRVAIWSRRIGLWQRGTTDGEAQRTPLVCLRAERPRTHVLVGWVHSQFSASPIAHGARAGTRERSPSRTLPARTAALRGRRG